MDLYAALGKEQFHALRRAMRSQWMAKHELEEPKRDSEWWSPWLRFWAHAIGVKPTDRILSGERRPRGLDAVEAAQMELPTDHVDVFSRNGREVVVVAEPYFDDKSDPIVELEAAWRSHAERHGLRFTSSLHDSWHYPGHTILLALWLPSAS